MTYEYLKILKNNHSALKLLNADNFPMIGSFFYQCFKANQRESIKESELITKLDDYLYKLNQEEIRFPKSPKSYLDDFTQSDVGYMRKFYDYSGDEPIYELTPHIEKLLDWLHGLQKREFVATESKIKIIVDLLKELEFETHMSDVDRIASLEQEKLDIDRQIEAIRDREDLRFDERKIKEQYIQIEKNSHELLSDFREIEHNFRDLNREAKQKIAIAEGSKGDVLGTIFEIEESIRDSNQGQSFYAFWDFLMDTEQMDRLDSLLENLYTLTPILEMDSDRKLENLKYNLLLGGEKSHKVLGKLIEQLRRFIDDKMWIESRRIVELSNEIEQVAIRIKDRQPTKRDFFTIDGVRISVESIASKNLFVPKGKEEFSHELVEEIITVDLSKLYKQVYIDEASLRANILAMLKKSSQFTLLELNALFPIKKGVAEVIVYLKLSKSMNNSYIEEGKEEIILIEDEHGNAKRVKMDKLVFVRDMKEKR